jgi:hypothetical protein
MRIVGECGGMDDHDTEEQLAELREAASDELRSASLDRVLSAAERGVREPTGLARGDVIVVDGDEWRLKDALSALRDKDLEVESVLEAITDSTGVQSDE